MKKIFQLLQFLFFRAKSQEAEAITDAQVYPKVYRDIIILKREDILSSSSSKVLNSLTLSDFIKSLEQREEFERAKLIILQTVLYKVVLKDRFDIMNLGAHCVKESNIIRPLSDIDAKEYLIASGYIDVFWSEEDINGKLTERKLELDSFDIDRIKEYIEEAYDSNMGLSWSSIDEAIDYVLDENLSEE
jgi:hypothetical protein